MAETNTLVFGYGSLINQDSLRASLPGVRRILPAYIRGFRREFNYPELIGWKSHNLDLAGIPFCAINVSATKDQQRVNGVVFEISNHDLIALQRRERHYSLVETKVFDFQNEKEMGTCLVFISDERDGKYKFGEPAQERYTEVCLDGAKELGDRFYQEFLATTYLNGKTLNQIPDLLR